MKCEVGGHTGFHDELVSELFHVDDHVVMVEQIPSRVCERCGEASFESDTVERVRSRVRGDSAPARHLTVDVFEFV